jgi:hypothetical protein
MTKEPIKEILYADEIRINKYFEQISSPEKTERLVTKNLKAGLTNIGVDINENIKTRSYTIYEKIRIVEEYLRENEQLLYERSPDIYTFENKAPFIKETITIQKIFLPPNKSEGKGLNIWIAEVEKEQKTSWFDDNIQVFLVEDHAIRERDTIPCSAYSYLLLLHRAYLDELKKTVLKDIPSAEFFKFTQRPLDLFRKFGAVFLDKRKITVLYKVRAAEYNTCFGYPIYILES